MMKMHESEKKFAEFLIENKKNYVYQPSAFKLKNTTYRTDFYCPEDDTYYEVVGTRQAYHINKNKIKEFRKFYPQLKFKIVMPDGSECQKGNVKLEKVLQIAEKEKLKYTQKNRLNSVENLRALMNETGLTIGPMSKLIGCSSRQITRWLNGEAVPTTVYVKLINKAVKRLQARQTKA